MGRLCYCDVLKAQFTGEMIEMDGGGVGPSDPRMRIVCPLCICHIRQISLFES